jgi:LmbE family N-acetylglucosaminyl deacetylase
VLQVSLEKARNLLFLGAHSDDIEIGCGGTILKLASANPKLNILWVVFSAEGKRRAEARKSATNFLKGAGSSRVIVKQFRTSFFPVEQEAIKEYFEALRKSFEPDTVFTHSREDRHQDHRLLSDLTWNAFRDHMILEYEIPKYDGDLGCPNVFIPLEAAVARRKAKFLQQAFLSQRDKHWFSEDTFLGLMRLRGVECATRYAEAFYCRKIVCR